jgi:hypothetical protein
MSGHEPSPFDEWALQYHYNGRPRTPENTPRRVNLLEKHKEALDPVYDQKRTPAGVACAIAAALRVLATHQPDDSLRALPKDPSRLYIYYNARALPKLEAFGPAEDYPELTADGGGWRKWPGWVDDGPITIRDAAHAIQTFGVASEEEWPWVDSIPEGNSRHVVLSLNDRPSDAAYAIGMASPQIESLRIDSDESEKAGFKFVLESVNALDALGELTLARLKLCLLEAQPAVFALKQCVYPFPYTLALEL